MKAIDGLILSAPNAWLFYSFENFILARKDGNRVGVFQILLGYKDYFQTFPSHDECIKLVQKVTSHNELPRNPADIFQRTHGDCCLVGSLIFRSDASIERIYYKYTNKKFILATYQGKYSPEKENELYAEINECDKIMESIEFDIP